GIFQRVDVTHFPRRTQFQYRTLNGLRRTNVTRPRRRRQNQYLVEHGGRSQQESKNPRIEYRLLGFSDSWILGFLISHGCKAVDSPGAKSSDVVGVAWIDVLGGSLEDFFYGRGARARIECAYQGGLA